MGYIQVFAAGDCEIPKRACGRKGNQVRAMKRIKKIMVVLAAVMILAGNVGMAVSAETGSETCAHEKVEITAGTYTNTYTHPAWVANKPNGDPILVPCTATETWQRYKTICRYCGELYGTREAFISATHSVHH